ncbi:uncharacterized protein [Macrobrachium rosenbergii]|uniref:uncharacterized protein n=1 Tax=Macrobrachium rosenbergii TaxID=79674 RepID=UPI0034D3B60D
MESDTSVEVENTLELHASAELQEYQASSSAAQGQDDIQADTASVFRDTFSSDTFSSFDEFDYLFKKYQNQTGSVFRVKSSSSVISENKRRQHQIPSELKYGSVSFVCVHYGNPSRKGLGIRQRQRYLPCGCNVLVALTARKNKLVITKTYLQHNHEVSVALQPFYSQKRRLTSSEMGDVEDVVKLNPDNKQLKSFLQGKYNKAVTMQDVRNLKRKVQSGNGMSDIGKLTEIVDEIVNAG